MAAKKLPKNVDLANSVDVAAGFFSSPSSADIKTDKKEKITAPTPDTKEPSADIKATKKKKNLGGRPKKDGLKNEQFTLTMNPEMYEKLRIIADEHTRGNFSGLIDQAIKSFCRENHIDLSAIQVKPEILEMYKKKQDKRNRK